jgi:hypothetical protein
MKFTTIGSVVLITLATTACLAKSYGLEVSRTEYSKQHEPYTLERNQSEDLEEIETETVEAENDGMVVRTNVEESLADLGIELLDDGTFVFPDGSMIMSDGEQILPDGEVLESAE